MSFSYDLYVPRASWLHALDPRVKLWATGLGMATALLLRQPPALAALLILAHVILLSARIPAERLRWVWARMAPVTLFILLLQPWTLPNAGPALVEMGPLRLTAAGLVSAVAFALRANALAFIAAALLLTTDQTHLVRGLVRLGLPYNWGLTISLALRYLPTTYGMYQSIVEAQRARGWAPGGESGLRRFVGRVRSYLPVLVAVMIGAIRLSDRLALALTARGLDAGPRTVWQEIRMTRGDWLALAATSGAFVALLAARFGAKVPL